MQLFFFAARQPIAQLYSGSPEVVALATGLLAWVAAYHVADALQTLCIFVLRSWHITLAPLALYGTLLWGGGLAGGYALAYRGVAGLAPLQSPAAFWLASAAALALVALAFTALLAYVLRRAQPHAPARPQSPR